VRQLYEQGLLRKASRGKFWLTHARDCFEAIEMFGDRAREQDGDTLAALSHIRKCTIGGVAYPAEDRKAWRRLMVEMGATADQADAALFRAAAFLGHRCPRFE
jgi:hypothetical protein